MRKVFAIFILAIFTFTSCQKEGEYDQDNFENFDEWNDEDSWEDNGDEDTDDDEWDDEDYSDDDEHGHNHSTEGAIVLYQVDGNSIEKIKDFDISDNLISYQTNENLHQDIWNFVSRLIPLEYRNKIDQFELFYGNRELLGYVEPVKSNDLSKWKFALAIEGAEGIETIDFSNDFTYTTLHEYGHVLTLNDNQLNINIDESSCQNYHTGEGCSGADSYINRIVELGWSDILNEEPSQIYDRYPDRFLTEYAATNPGEDIAEVFTAFIILENKPSGNKIADQKVKLLYEYPELVTLRKEIRASLTPARVASLNMEEYKTILPRIYKGYKH